MQACRIGSGDDDPEKILSSTWPPALQHDSTDDRARYFSCERERENNEK